ncbi:hypothetical protein BCV69DRAFT_115928 [Microstroma glucosiphilum]|uniref:Uncharacterized protein n=1 Tax=Pseudomicrostroma glucosiphilum TaxID=1684307 RepID=A0A316UDJ7_9BASI|nr:hypothetical protein BCV69DRAFT_115928 [Pseudomicrostroma glucosiphilum]PWN23327.1 hypothetical protein BCV69DRAFT_115928 [Pseudomicrostroma glucosiphilum]
MKSQFLGLLLAFLLAAAASPSVSAAPVGLTESDLAQLAQYAQQLAPRDLADAVDVDARASGGRAMNKEQWAHYKGAMLEKLDAHPNHHHKREVEEAAFEDERDLEDFEERDLPDFDERDLEDLANLINARASGGRAMNKEQWAHYKDAMLEKLNAHPNHKREVEDADFEERDLPDFDERDLEDFDERDLEDLVNLVNARASGGRAMNKEQWAHYKGAMLEKLDAHPNHRRDFDEDAFEEREFDDADVDARASGGRAMNKEQWAHYKDAMLEKLNAHPNHRRDVEDADFEERDFEDFDERDFEDLVDARASDGRAMNKAQWAHYKDAMLNKLDAHPNHRRDFEEAGDFEERDFPDADVDERDLADDDVDERDFVDFEVEA